MSAPLPVELRRAAAAWSSVMGATGSGSWAAASMAAGIVLELITLSPELAAGFRAVREWGGTAEADRASAVELLRLLDEGRLDA